MQETNSASGLAAAGTALADDGMSNELTALRAELAKWQARVPKLAGALRERSAEVETLKAELEKLREAGPADTGGSSSGIQARDALIEELEAKVQALGGRYQDAEGQLRARDLEISRLREEAAEWREKWQSVTTALDEQADAGESKDRELKRLQGELDELLAARNTQSNRIKDQDLELATLKERARSLEARNQNLFETTELAKRQIETLGENLEHLRGELKASKQALEEQQARQAGSDREIADLKGQIASRDQDIEFLHGHVEEKQAEIARLGERLSGLEPLRQEMEALLEEKAVLVRQLEERDADLDRLAERLSEIDVARKAMAAAETDREEVAGELSRAREELAALAEEVGAKNGALESQKEEIRRLEACVARAEETTGRFEAERRQLSEQLDELKKRNEHLESQLSERSSLVVGLEEEKSAITSRSSSLEAENRRLSEALEKARQAATGNADHIAQLDARMDRQKQLMENLEMEFAEAQEEHARALKAHQQVVQEKDAEIALLSEKVNEDSVAALKSELSDMEAQLEAARSIQREAQEQLAGEQKRAEDLAREVEQLRSGEDAIRETLNEKVAQLEKQLHKQSKIAAQAEENAARAKAALEAQQAGNSRPPEEISDENALLQAEVLKLEGMVRERTEQLNKLRWQQDMLEKQAGSDSADPKMLIVLNQQLDSAREENRKLKEALRNLESRAEAGGGDDLASIRGIGPKLVEQLAELGITRFDQIATLSESDLDDPGHPLHGMKGRVLKDDWIRQAAELSNR